MSTSEMTPRQRMLDSADLCALIADQWEALGRFDKATAGRALRANILIELAGWDRMDAAATDPCRNPVAAVEFVRQYALGVARRAGGRS